MDQSERSALQRLMKTRDGEVLMAWLERTFYDCHIGKSEDYARAIGRRDVVLYIKTMTQEVSIDD